VIATGTDNGMVEFVPSHTLAAVLEKHKAIAKFLAMQNPDPQGPFGMHKEVSHTTPCAPSPSAVYV
jgi:phosphatidylinositol 3-kinase